MTEAISAEEAAFAACERFLDATDDDKATAELALHQALAALSPTGVEHVLEHFCDGTTGEGLIAFDIYEVSRLRHALEIERFERIETQRGTDPKAAAPIAALAHPIRDLLDEANAQYPAAEKDEIALRAARQQVTKPIPDGTDELRRRRDAALAAIRLALDGDEGLTSRIELERLAILKAAEQDATMRLDAVTWMSRWP